jgi:hypothetical protein
MSEYNAFKVEGFTSANGVVGTRETTYGLANSVWRHFPVKELLQDPGIGSVLRDDFFATDNTNNYTLVTDSGGTAVIADAEDGVLRITNNGTDNDESYLSSKAESWIFNDRPIHSRSERYRRRKLPSRLRSWTRCFLRWRGILCGRRRVLEV